MSVITSCGILTVVICDFAFFAPVAISGSPDNRCISVYAKKKIKKVLRCISPECRFKNKGEIHPKQQRPAAMGTHTGRLTTNDSKSIEAAMRNHITHPQGRDSHNLNKFTWRFMQCLTGSIAIFTVTAATEREARARLPHAHLIFVARIRQEASHG
ncbi:TPA: host cell division inhibitor Icd-like protein [Escherichia coli]